MALTKTDVITIATALAASANHPDPEGYAATVANNFEKPELYKAKLEEAAAEQAALDAEAAAVAAPLAE